MSSAMKEVHRRIMIAKHPESGEHAGQRQLLLCRWHLLYCSLGESFYINGACVCMMGRGADGVDAMARMGEMMLVMTNGACFQEWPVTVQPLYYVLGICIDVL
jgi:hypothetical protein